jgi:hypothetical protein
MNSIPYHSLADADLLVDAAYEGRRIGNAGDDPLPELLGVSNQGGFRILGTRQQPRLIVVTTSMLDPEWPDSLDPETGLFTYYGDNKKPGRELHDTPRYGNLLLRDMFEALHTERRDRVPPVLLFANAGRWRDMVFKGLAVPGAVGLTSMDDLVAVWKVTSGRRFQNYRATFTILDVPSLDRDWINAIRAGENWRSSAPKSWTDWVVTGRYRPLKAVRSLDVRTRDQQMLRIPGHDGQDSGMMADTVPAPWRTVFRSDGGHFGGWNGMLSAMMSEHCPR